jgi:hypothetical protein
MTLSHNGVSRSGCFGGVEEIGSRCVESIHQGLWGRRLHRALQDGENIPYIDILPLPNGVDDQVIPYHNVMYLKALDFGVYTLHTTANGIDD